MTLNEAKTKRDFKIQAFGCVSMEVERQRSQFELLAATRRRANWPSVHFEHVQATQLARRQANWGSVHFEQVQATQHVRASQACTPPPRARAPRFRLHPDPKQHMLLNNLRRSPRVRATWPERPLAPPFTRARSLPGAFCS